MPSLVAFFSFFVCENLPPKKGVSFSTHSPERERRDDDVPFKPQKPCRAIGCKNKCEQGQSYCRDHLLLQQREYNKYKRNQDANDFYHSREWRIMRTEVLKESPLCAMCLQKSIYTPASIVDHITPISQGGARLERRNLQPLCSQCHEIKSREEGSRFGNQAKEKDNG